MYVLCSWLQQHIVRYDRKEIPQMGRQMALSAEESGAGVHGGPQLSEGLGQDTWRTSS